MVMGSGRKTDVPPKSNEEMLKETNALLDMSEALSKKVTASEARLKAIDTYIEKKSLEMLAREQAVAKHEQDVEEKHHQHTKAGRIQDTEHSDRLSAVAKRELAVTEREKKVTFKEQEVEKEEIRLGDWRASLKIQKEDLDKQDILLQRAARELKGGKA